MPASYVRHTRQTKWLVYYFGKITLTHQEQMSPRWIVAAFLCLSFAGCSVNNTSQNQYNSNTVGNSSGNRLSDSNWSKCVNVAGGYSFNYPSDWKIWEHAIGAYEETYCDVARQNITLSPDVPDGVGSRMDFIVSSGAELNPVPKSLDDYFTENPDLLRNGTKISGTDLSGEPTIWLRQSDGATVVFCWHQGNILEIAVMHVPIDEMNAIVSSFQFR
jgi:hypothetical protein